MNRSVTALTAVALAVGLGLGQAPAFAQDMGEVVVASWGGSFQDAQREAIFKPFEEATGIKVIEATGPSMAKVRAMVESGNTEWDVTGMTPGDLLVLARDGLVEKLDYDNYFKGEMFDLPDNAFHPYGMGDFYYSKVIGFNTDVYSKDGEHPQSWADVWDVEKFPGPRMVDEGGYVIPPLEYALMADGVPPDQLYPLDMERAYRSLAKIKPHVPKFATKAAMPPQALVAQEVVIAASTLGRLVRLKEDGAPVDFVWNQGLIQHDYWIIPKGAKNYENAMKFIEFAMNPQSQAGLARIQPLGPLNTKAFELLSEERARILPSHPDNLKLQVFLNAEFWASVGPDGKSNIEKNMEMWNEFSLQ
jgi:putative spermidine/putrescine transport system substrate-binding protein